MKRIEKWFKNSVSDFKNNAFTKPDIYLICLILKFINNCKQTFY